MRRSFLAVILLLTLDFARAQQGIAGRPPEHSDTAGVAWRLSIASFGGSSQTSIRALATDSSGSIFVTGTTTAAGFPVKNAAQPFLGEATILRTSDLGATWTPIGNAPEVVSVLAPDPVAPQVLFAGTNTGIFKSTDNGQTWRPVYTFQPNPSPDLQFNGALVIDPGNHLRLAALAGNGSLIRSLDGGEAWTSGCPVLSCGGQLIADPSGSGALLMITDRLYLSRDWGLTFNAIGSPGTNNLRAAAMVPAHPGWIYAAGGLGTFGVLSLSTDYGVTWTRKSSPPTNFSVITGLAVDPDQPNLLVAATVDGLYKSTDSAGSWTLQSRLSTATPGRQATFAMVSQHCNPAGGILARVTESGSYQVAFSPDYGVTFMTPQLRHVASVVTGPNCLAYAVRQPAQAGSDAFVAKLAPDGSTLWATFLGGSDQDTAVALAVDGQGNAYVTGDTVSPDFPVTVPRIGVRGASSVFVTRYSPDGKIAYSAVIGGEAANYSHAIALDLSQNVYLLGYGNSQSFPVTPGALGLTLNSGSYTSFLVKLSPSATVIYATFLGDSYAHPGAILVGADDQPIVAGNGPAPGLPPPPQGTSPDFLVKLDPTGSRVVHATYIEGSSSWGYGPSALGADASGNLVLLGSTEGTIFPITAGAYASPSPSSACGGFGPYYSPSSDIYVTKLRASDWNPIYTVLLRCGGQSGAVAVDSTGAVILAAGAGSRFPLHNPLLAAPSCSNNYDGSGAIARLNPDGSALEFATFIDTCGAPAIALAGDGSIYVGGVVPYRPDSIAGVFQLSSTNPRAISLDQISNAFSGDSSAVVGGGLYALSVSGFRPPTLDLGLNPSQDLPTQLGGVEVTFDGVPAAILRTSPGQVIVVSPWNLSARASAPNDSPGRAIFTSVQLSYNGVFSNAAEMPVLDQLPGLLVNQFPISSLSSGANFPDGNVRNQDGSRNDANHPAAAGSMITVFVTGMGVAQPTGAPGSIATSQTLASTPPIYSTWARYSGTDILRYPPETVYSVPGFVSATFQIPIKVPNSLQSLNGADLGNGVWRAPFGLTPYPPFSRGSLPSSNAIGVYLK